MTCTSEEQINKVWVVGICDCEMTSNRYICRSKPTALKRWEELRQELIQRAKDGIEYCKSEGYGLDTEERILSNLMATDDPEKMNNYPQEQPFIDEMILEE